MNATAFTEPGKPNTNRLNTFVTGMSKYTPETEQYLIKAMREMITEERWEKFQMVLDNRTDHITVVLEDIYQPHNASAVIRTCELLGIQHLHIIENENTWEVNPDIVVGSNKWINIIKYHSEAFNTPVCYKKLKKKGYQIIATSPHKAGYTLETLPIDKKTALVFGNEGNGLTEEALAMADGYLKIPSYGFTESYNLSVSAALCMFSLTGRLKGSEVAWQLPPEERQTLLLDYCLKTVRNPQILVKNLLQKRQQ